MIAFTLAIALANSPTIADPLPGAKRVLIIGDSITAAGYYTAYLEGYFATKFPDRKIEFINLGLPSETISGLSEPSHPWPRPNVHERLDRALLTLKPDIVLACYGMNDGIYHPFSDARFVGFKDGVEKLIARCETDAIPLYLITPPPFDPTPIRKILKEADATDFGWQTPYVRYQEEVLSRYAAWEKTRSAKDVTVIDSQGPIVESLQQQRRMLKHPDYRLADDGVHMNADGHWLIASAILKKWNCPLDGDDARIDVISLRASRGDVKDIKSEASGIRFVWTPHLPIPEDHEWSEALRESGVLPVQRLVLTGLRDGRYLLYEGSRSVGNFEVKNGTATLDVRKFAELSSNRRANEVGELIRKRERIMSPAWLDYVGHKRPDTGKGLPLEEAKKQAEPISEEIRRLAVPVALELRIVGQ